jgi:predicted dinucleotide-binding enzyme
MKVGVLGSGDVARALGTGFLRAHNEVRLGTRQPEEEKVQQWLAAGGSDASVGSFAEAAAFGPIAVLAVRGAAALDVLKLAGHANFAGKVVIDPTNPLDFAPNAPPALFIGGSDSLGEQVQRAIPKAHVVKAFNIVGNTSFYQPKFPGGPPSMLYCGNDAGAKKTVAGILDEFGWPNSIDIGGIEGSRFLEPLCILWVRSALTLGDWDIAFKVLRK